MRMILHAKMPNEPFNSFVKDGSAGKKIQKILEEIKPEATYFTEFDGRRSALRLSTLQMPPRYRRSSSPGFFFSTPPANSPSP